MSTGSSVGVILPDTVSEVERQHFELLLESLTNLLHRQVSALFFSWALSVCLSIGSVQCPLCLRNDLLCVDWDVKPYTLTHCVCPSVLYTVCLYVPCTVCLSVCLSGTGMHRDHTLHVSTVGWFMVG